MTVLNFQNSMADLVAFNLYRTESSALVKKWYVVFRLILTAMLGALALIPSWIFDAYGFMVLALPFGIYGYVSFPRHMREKQKNVITKQLVELRAERFVNIPRRLVLEDDGLLSTSAAGQSTYPYWEVMDVVKTDQYVFIVANGGVGYAIPRSAGADQHDMFFTELQARVDSARALRSAPA